MLNKEEMLENIKDASRETLLKVVDTLVEMSNAKDEIIETQKIMIGNLEVQNTTLKVLLDYKDKEEK